MGSWMWKKLLKYRQEAKAFYKKEIRSGVATSFWYDNWSSLGCLYDRLGDRGFIDLGIQSKATVAEVLVNHRRRRHRNPILISVEVEIDKVRSGQGTSDTDVALWRGKDGKFKGKFSTLHTWNQIRSVKPMQMWYKGVWFSHSTPKYSFILWLAMHNRLTTGDKMCMWNVNVDPSCVLCNAPMESREHLFFLCPYSSQVWTHLMIGLLEDLFTTSFGDIVTKLSDARFRPTKRFIFRYALQATMHSIWCERNKRRHGELGTSPTRMISFIDRIIRNRLSSLKEATSRNN